MNEIKRLLGQIIYVDIDQTICDSKFMFDNGEYNGEFNYAKSAPDRDAISKVNRLYENNFIVLYTARGKRTGKIDWSDFTRRQMTSWGVKYHDIRFDKPHYDLLIDDRAVTNFDQIPIN